MGPESYGGVSWASGGIVLPTPFPNLKGAGRWGLKVEPRRSGSCSGQGAAQTRPDSRTAGLRSWVGEARRWEVPEEGRLRGSTQRGVAKRREEGLPFSPEGREVRGWDEATARRVGWGLGVADDVKVRGMKEMLSLLWG